MQPIAKELKTPKSVQVGQKIIARQDIHIGSVVVRAGETGTIEWFGQFDALVSFPCRRDYINLEALKKHTRPFGWTPKKGKPGYEVATIWPWKE